LSRLYAAAEEGLFNKAYYESVCHSLYTYSDYYSRRVLAFSSLGIGDSSDNLAVAPATPDSVTGSSICSFWRQPSDGPTLSYNMEHSLSPRSGMERPFTPI